MSKSLHKRSFSITKSLSLFAEALEVLPAGTGSNARLLRATCPIEIPCTIFIQRAHGAHIWDVDGNKYIDYRLGYGPVILGHGYKPVLRAVDKAEHDGIVYALGNRLEVELAKRINNYVPCAEMTRFANSGTEATMTALRIARGFTKKERFIKFEGHFHGTNDYMLYSNDPPFKSRLNVPYVQSIGIPKDIQKYILIEEWNNFQSIERMVKKYHDQIAAIITEPIMGNAAAIMPKEGYLAHLRELCDDYNIVLIFDEVKTGFRIAMGGAQEVYHVKPDIACLAKSLGNGYPIAAITGQHEFMELIGPGKVAHGGTYSSNPVSMAAALQTLHDLDHRDVHEYLSRFGTKMMQGIHEVFLDNNIPHIVQGHPTMFQFLLTNRNHVENYRDLKHCDMKWYAKIHLELMKRGVMFDEDNEEVIFTCFSHTAEDREKTLHALDASIKAIKIKPKV
ncbi:MAG: glutamate-1-semialdehyde 2,1-aminomutase [Nanoarchaeota archaeon]